MATAETVSHQCLSDPAGHLVPLGEGYLRLKIDDKPGMVASIGRLVPQDAQQNPIFRLVSKRYLPERCTGTFDQPLPVEWVGHS